MMNSDSCEEDEEQEEREYCKGGHTAAGPWSTALLAARMLCVRGVLKAHRDVER